MSFLPDNYKRPTNDNYMKFEQGANKFRVLSDAITGWEYWLEDDGEKRKPIREKERSDVPGAMWQRDQKPKHFWAFVVYNHGANAVQILQITQVTIQDALEALYINEDWGDPKDYDITVTRKGEGFDTTYSVAPSPKKDLTEEMLEAYEQVSVNLEALYTGDDPFAVFDLDELDKAIDAETKK